MCFITALSEARRLAPRIGKNVTQLAFRENPRAEFLLAVARRLRGGRLPHWDHPVNSDSGDPSRAGCAPAAARQRLVLCLLELVVVEQRKAGSDGLIVLPDRLFSALNPPIVADTSPVSRCLAP